MRKKYACSFARYVACIAMSLLKRHARPPKCDHLGEPEVRRFRTGPSILDSGLAFHILDLAPSNGRVGLVYGCWRPSQSHGYTTRKYSRNASSPAWIYRRPKYGAEVWRQQLPLAETSTLKIYFPYLNKKDISSLEQLNERKQELLENTKNFIL